jgi:polyisoprenoid-binding protein YceI
VADCRVFPTDATLEQSSTTIGIKTRGRLTIAGMTRDIAMQVNGTPEPDGAYVLTGQLPIRMSGYRIKPPTPMMGTIRTGNEVTVTFRRVVQATN